MYILKEIGGYHAFAIIKNDFKHKVHLAVKEEFSFDSVKGAPFKFPSVGEDVTITFEGTSNGEPIIRDIELTNLIDY
jgi:hypothetical protein